MSEYGDSAKQKHVGQFYIYKNFGHNSNVFHSLM